MTLKELYAETRSHMQKSPIVLSTTWRASAPAAPTPPSSCT